MKKMYILGLLLLWSVSGTICAQSDYTPPQFTQQTDANFRLFPTRNNYNFIRLDTRTGQMDMVEWSPTSPTGEGEIYSLSSVKRVFSEKDELPGRFTLYAIKNFYNNFCNFILLDQIDGRVWLVQWSFDEKYRLVTQIR